MLVHGRFARAHPAVFLLHPFMEFHETLPMPAHEFQVGLFRRRQPRGFETSFHQRKPGGVGGQGAREGVVFDQPHAVFFQGCQQFRRQGFDLPAEFFRAGVAQRFGVRAKDGVGMRDGVGVEDFRGLLVIAGRARRLCSLASWCPRVRGDAVLSKVSATEGSRGSR